MYKLLKFIFQQAIFIFYRKCIINNKEESISSGPLIIAANHPNTLMDPLLIAANLKQRVGFIAKATLFSNGFLKLLFKQLHMIPIRRTVDGDTPEAKAENKRAFEKCYEYLSNKGIILIFPEGNSFHEMKLRPLKTGAARIALEFEALNNFSMNTKILPIALNYSDPALFKKDIIINFGKAITISDYKELYLADPKGAVKKLTDDLRERLENIIILTENTEQELLYKKIHSIYRNRLTENLKTAGAEISSFSISKEIANAIMYYESKQPESYQLIKSKIDHYSNLIQKLKIRNSLIEENKKLKVNLIKKIITPLYLIIGAPFYLFGLLTNYIPYIIPSKVVKLITNDIEYKAPIMMITGLITFPLTYTILVLVFKNYITADLLPLISFCLLLPISGFYTMHYYNYVSEAKSLFFINTSLKEKDRLYSLVTNTREEIVLLLDKASEVYSASLTK